MVDDFGDAVAMQYRCQGCRRWHGAVGGKCRACKTWWAVQWRSVPENRDRERARKRDSTQRALEDPAVREQKRKREREARRRRMQRDPEREHAKERERNHRYRARLKQEAERYRAYLEDARIRGRIRRAEGGALAGGRRVNGTGAQWAREYVPAAPLVLAVERCAQRLGGEASVMRDAGLTMRTLYAWRSGERTEATWEAADRVMLALGLCWWEVFDPDDPAARAAWGDDE